MQENSPKRFPNISFKIFLVRLLPEKELSINYWKTELRISTNEKYFSDKRRDALKRHQCTQCGPPYRWRSQSLIRNNKYSCSKPFLPCPYCRNHFKRQTTLNRHINMWHGDISVPYPQIFSTGVIFQNKQKKNIFYYVESRKNCTINII